MKQEKISKNQTIVNYVNEINDKKKQAKRTQYFKNDRGLLLSNGNNKIGTDTLILNMGSATRCPSRRLGLCKLNKECYALKAEIQYWKTVPKYRNCQQMYWLRNNDLRIFEDIEKILTTKKRNKKPLYESIKYLRINESGDFWSQKCIEKLNNIAKWLKEKYDIITYTYTARSDLDFSNVYFNVKGSGHDNGNNGKTIACELTKSFQEVFSGKMVTLDNTLNQYFLCPMDCSKCNKCKVRNNLDIVFPLH